MSGAPIISGTIQLPKPPIIAGMTMKKTMIRPWAVISTFQWCSASSKLALPGADRPALGQDLDARLHQLGAHDAGNGAADDPGDDREDQIERADVLVVRRHEPAGEEARLVVGIVMRVCSVVGLQRKGVGGNGAHDLSLLPLLILGRRGLVGGGLAHRGCRIRLRAGRGGGLRRGGNRRSRDRRSSRCCRAPRPAWRRAWCRPCWRPRRRTAPAARPRPRSACSRGGRRTARCTGRNRRPAGRP